MSSSLRRSDARSTTPPCGRGAWNFVERRRRFDWAMETSTQELLSRHSHCTRHRDNERESNLHKRKWQCNHSGGNRGAPARGIAGASVGLGAREGSPVSYCSLRRARSIHQNRSLFIGSSNTHLRSIAASFLPGRRHTPSCPHRNGRDRWSGSSARSSGMQPEASDSSPRWGGREGIHG